MDGKKGNEPEKSLTLRYLLENPALLQPPEDVEEGTLCRSGVDVKSINLFLNSHKRNVILLGVCMYRLPIFRH